MNYFCATGLNIYHISVGAVLRNKQGQIAVHHYRQEKPGWLFPDCYILMRETIEPNETIEAALGRGLAEEFGARAIFRQYLGSSVCWLPTPKGVQAQKTTLYCLMDLDGELGQPTDLHETHGPIEWHEAKFLIGVMKEQRKRLKREDADESEILERLLALEK